MIDVFLCVADHYEPRQGGVANSLARRRHEEWLHRYKPIAEAHRDSDGRKAVHTFFYPWDEFDGWEFRTLQDLCASGVGEIELHLHHRDDTADSLYAILEEAVRTYRSLGALSRWSDGRSAFGFIHGNWALDNSRKDGGRNYCGVDNELDVLMRAGCYCDFTFPSWRHRSQPRLVNAIYYAAGRAGRCKSYDRGSRAAVGRRQRPDELLLVQGPLVPVIVSTKRGLRMVMDDGDLAGYRRYEPARLDRWLKAGIHVAHQQRRIFIKLHCHGAADASRDVLLGGALDALYCDAEQRFRDQDHYRLHYVTARELYNIIKATEEGVQDVEQSRDWVLAPPYAT